MRHRQVGRLVSFVGISFYGLLITVGYGVFLYVTLPDVPESLLIVVTGGYFFSLLIGVIQWRRFSRMLNPDTNIRLGSSDTEQQDGVWNDLELDSADIDDSWE